MADDVLQHYREAYRLQAQRFEAFLLRAQRFHERVEAWGERHARRLEALPPAVAAEVMGLAREQIRRGHDPDLTDADIETAEITVVSRLRLQRHGRLDRATAADQHVAIRAELGLAPKASNEPVQRHGPAPPPDTDPLEESLP
jgi:hypothetical protein